MKGCVASAARVARRGSGRRGFALPLVMLLALVGMIGATMIIEFQGQARLAESRQVETYRAHHEQQGLTEVIELLFWREGGDMRAGGDGSAPEEEQTRFVIRGERNQTYQVEISDAQGTMLDSARAMRHVEDPHIAGCYLRALEAVRSAGGAEPERYLRKHGPAAVNVNTASHLVLDALARSVEDSGAARRFADTVIEERARRNGTPITATDLQRLASDAGITDQQTSSTLLAMLTDRSTIKRVEVWIRDPQRRSVAHHKGLIRRAPERRGTGAGAAGAAAQSSSSQMWSFLSWERVIEEEMGQGAGGIGR